MPNNINTPSTPAMPTNTDLVADLFEIVDRAIQARVPYAEFQKQVAHRVALPLCRAAALAVLAGQPCQWHALAP